MENSVVETVEVVKDPVAERIEAIKKQALALAQKRQVEMLNTSNGINNYLASEDRKLLNSIASRIAVAYDKPLATGFMFAENIEILVAITNRLQYANKSVRELLEPGEADLDLYAIFDRSIRDELLEAYGSLPYLREATVLTMPDGSTEVLDAELVATAKQGTPCNVEKLNSCIEILSLRLGLYCSYVASEDQATRAFTQASQKLKSLDKLAELKSQLLA